MNYVLTEIRSLPIVGEVNADSVKYVIERLQDKLQDDNGNWWPSSLGIDAHLVSPFLTVERLIFGVSVCQ